jgi:NAD(P)-dependent dehydrogenase (short-subunit alcohol dehydrogenase family)
MLYHDHYKNKTALVTGGGSGIGRALCLELAKAGAIVICTDINETAANETATLTERGSITAKQLDVSQLIAFEEIISGTIAQYGRLDIIFNNAGIAVSGEMRDVSPAQWKKIFDINFFGVLYGSQTAYGYMVKQGGGQIVNIASLAGLINDMVLLAPYSVTKHAVVSYSRSLRLEAKGLGVKVNVVCPGYIRTAIAVNGVMANTNDAWNESAKETIAVKGIGPEKAVRYMLEKVAANKGIIVFPFVYKLLLLASVLFKGPYKLFAGKYMERYRKKYRVDS